MNEGRVQAEVRKSLRLRQIEVAKEAQMDRSRLSLIENGWIEPKPQELARIQSAIQRLAEKHFGRCIGV